MSSQTSVPGTTVVITVRVHAASPDDAALLVARIQALATEAGAQPPPALPPANQTDAGPIAGTCRYAVGVDPPGPRLAVYPDRAVALLDGAPVTLTRLEFALLAFLLGRPGRVFGRTELLTRVWGGHVGRSRRTVDVHVRRLRGKLGDVAGVIRTVRGIGYRLDPTDAVRLVRDPARTA